MFITESYGFGYSAPNIEPNKDYVGIIGSEQMLIENAENTFNLFKAHCRVDAKEIGLVREGASDYEIQSFLEGALSDAWDKLKAFLKKIWEKIKAILKGYIARLEAFMGKNGYAFYEKYKKIIWNGVHLKDVKTKYRKVKDTELADALKGKSVETLDLGDLIVEHKMLKENPDYDSDDIKDSALKQINPRFNDFKNLKKDFMEEYFETEETEELEDGKIGEYIKYIMEKKSIVEKFEKLRDQEDKMLQKWDKFLQKAADESGKTMAKSGGADNSIDSKPNVILKYGDAEGKGRMYGYDEYDKSVKANSLLNTHMKDAGDGHKIGKTTGKTTVTTASQKLVTAAQTALSCASNVVTTYNSVCMEAGKFAISQSRRIAAIIVAYRSRHKNEAADFEESDIFYQVIGEAAEWEAMSDMDDQIEIAY